MTLLTKNPLPVDIFYVSRVCCTASERVEREFTAICQQRNGFQMVSTCVCVCVRVILSAHKSIIPIVVVAHIRCESFLVVALLLMLNVLMLRRYRRVIRDSFISAWSLWCAMINFYGTVTIDSVTSIFICLEVCDFSHWARKKSSIPSL